MAPQVSVLFNEMLVRIGSTSPLSDPASDRIPCRETLGRVWLGHPITVRADAAFCGSGKPQHRVEHALWWMRAHLCSAGAVASRLKSL